jgi:hypothetical protein
MTIIIKDYIVRFKISINDISLVEVFKGKKDFRNIKSGSLFSKSSFSIYNSSKISAWAEVKN